MGTSQMPTGDGQTRWDATATVSEVRCLHDEARQALSSGVYEALRDWLTEETRRATEPIRAVVDMRRKRVRELSEQIGRAPSGEMAVEHLNAFIRQTDPRAIVRELQEASRLEPVIQTYERVLSTLSAHPDVGPFFRRYRLPREAVARVLRAGCVPPLSSTEDRLKSLSRELCPQPGWLASFFGGLWRRAVVRGGGVGAAAIAAPVVGPLAPLVGIGSALLLGGIVNNPTSKAKAICERVKPAFDQFDGSFQGCIERLERNVHYALASLYGGLLVRVNSDLNTVGRTLAAIDVLKGSAEVALTPQAEAEFRSWAEGVLAEFSKLKAAQAWLPLSGAADAALRVSFGDPLRAHVVGGDGKAYAVHLARWRVLALEAAADVAWRIRRYEDSCRLCLRLLEQTNIACDPEREQNGQELVLQRAGLRLAMAASAGALASDEVTRALSALPAFVFQADERLAAAGERGRQGIGHCRKESVPGEHLARTTRGAAGAIALYARECGVEVDLGGRTAPDVVSRPEAVEVWKAAVFAEAHRSYRRIFRALRRDAAAIDTDSAFYQWLQRQAGRQTRRIALVAACAIVCSLAAAVGVRALVAAPPSIMRDAAGWVTQRVGHVSAAPVPNAAISHNSPSQNPGVMAPASPQIQRVERSGAGATAESVEASIDTLRTEPAHVLGDSPTGRVSSSASTQALPSARDVSAAAQQGVDYEGAGAQRLAVLEQARVASQPELQRLKQHSVALASSLRGEVQALLNTTSPEEKRRHAVLAVNTAKDAIEVVGAMAAVDDQGRAAHLELMSHLENGIGEFRSAMLAGDGGRLLSSSEIDQLLSADPRAQRRQACLGERDACWREHGHAASACNALSSAGLECLLRHN